LSSRVEHVRQTHPPEITLKARAPDHRRDATLRRIKRADWWIRSTQGNSLRRVWLRWLGIDSHPRDVFINLALHPDGGLIGEADVLPEMVGEGKLAAIPDSCKAPEQHDTLRAERLQADRMLRTEQRPRCHAAGWLYELLSRYIEQSALNEPDHDVTATV